MKKSNNKKKKSLVGTPICFFYEHIFNLDGLIMAGDAIKDFVLTMIVISVVIKYSLLPHMNKGSVFIFSICLAIMLVAISTATKWLDVVFGDDKTKEGRL